MGFVVRLENVSYRYQESDGAAPVQALDDVSLNIGDGAFFILMGPSGSGKSTLLHVLGGVDRVTSGRLHLGGHELSALSERQLTLLRRVSIGFVFQSFNLIPTLTVEENVAFPLSLAGTPRAETASRVSEVLAATGLSNRARHLPHQLSGGEMQRVAIGRAIVHRPQLLLADEPTGNLDTRTGETILELLAEVRVAYRPTVVMATHSERAARLGDEIVEIVDGRIAGTPR